MKTDRICSISPGKCRLWRGSVLSYCSPQVNHREDELEMKKIKDGLFKKNPNFQYFAFSVCVSWDVGGGCVTEYGCD
jgi:hypothetical protein